MYQTKNGICTKKASVRFLQLPPLSYQTGAVLRGVIQICTCAARKRSRRYRNSDENVAREHQMLTPRLPRLRRYRKKWRLALGIVCLFCSFKCVQDSQAKTASVRGQVIDADSRTPIATALIRIIRIEPIKNAAEKEKRPSPLQPPLITGADGYFRFEKIPEGKQKLQVVKTDYYPFELVIGVNGNTADLQVLLKKRVLQLETITVSGSKRGLSQFEVTTDMAFDEAKLQKQFGMTLAATLGNEVGISQRTMGRAVARPVIRGLGGARLLILENGERTGDKSESSADHVVALEPTSANRVEIIRGPASLIYGSNTLGGVINVKSNSIPDKLPETPNMHLTFHGETVNSGRTANTGITLPIGDFVGRLTWNRRLAKDTRTPLGILENTALSNVNFSTGASLIQNWGYAGITGGSYRSDYGIPGSPEGHITGINIALERQRYEAKLEYRLNRTSFDKFRLQAAYTRYQHQELEANGSLGVEFGVLTYNISTMMHTRDNAIIGMWAQYRDHATGGFYWTPHTREFALAGFYLNQRDFGKFTLQGAIRYDIRRVEPFHPNTVIRAGTVKQRDFNGVSAAASGIYHWNQHIHTGTTLMKTFRAPGIEELFSDGPHLAVYSYEIGNAELAAENGYGTELFGRYSNDRFRIKFALFRNQIENYLIPANTGQKEWGSGPAGWLWIYQYRGHDVIMDGAEMQLQTRVTPHFQIQLDMSYVNGTIVGHAKDRKPLERTPPFNGKCALHYIQNSFDIHLTTRFAAHQTRLGEFEQPTDAYIIYDTGAYFKLPWGKFTHVVVFEINNLLNTLYREHLSRIKSTMPEPGRNLKFFYKLNF